MKVRDMLRAKGDHVETILPDATVTMAVHKLVANNIGALVVSVDGAEVLGVFSERDVVRALARQGAQLLELRVRDVMSRGTPWCAPDDPLSRVMAEMTRSRNRHLPVVDDGRLQGLVSIGDVVKHRMEEIELQSNVLRDAYIARP